MADEPEVLTVVNEEESGEFMTWLIVDKDGETVARLPKGPTSYTKEVQWDRALRMAASSHLQHACRLALQYIKDYPNDENDCLEMILETALRDSERPAVPCPTNPSNPH